MTAAGGTVAVLVEDLEVVYQRGAEPAVSDLSFRLGPGDALLLTGGHGSGKSSVLRALLGLVVAGGRVEVLGAPPGDRRAAGRIGYAPQGRGFRETLTPMQMVSTVVTLRRGSRDDDAARSGLAAAGMPEDRWDAHDLDMEAHRRLAMACALAGDPDLLILDDPWEFMATEEAVLRTRERGGIVIATSHDPGGLPDLFGTTIELVGVDEDADDGRNTADADDDASHPGASDVADGDASSPTSDAPPEPGA